MTRRSSRRRSSRRRADQREWDIGVTNLEKNPSVYETQKKTFVSPAVFHQGGLG